MAEETVNSLVTSKKSESDFSSSGETSIRKPSSPDNAGSNLPSSNRRSSDSCHDFNNSRRNSTGKPSSPHNNQKIVPIYLRASTGSCHDYCKYGHKHAFEEKERYPFRKRMTRTPFPSEKQNHAVTISLGERKKAAVLKQTVSPDMKSHSLKHGASPGAIGSAGPPEIIKRLPSEKVEVSPKCDPLSQHKMSKAGKRMNNFSNKHSPFPSEMQNPAVTLSLVERKKATVLKRTVSPDMKSHSLNHGASPGAINSAGAPEIIKRLPSEKVEVSPKCDPMSQHKKSQAEKRMNNRSNKHSPSLRPFPMKQSSSFQTLKSSKKVEKAEKTMSNLSLKSSPSVGPQPSAKKAEKAEKARNNLSHKSSPSVGQQRAVSKSSLLFRIPQSINGRGKRKEDMKTSRNMVVTKASAKKVFATPTASLSPKPSMNRNGTTKAKKNRSSVVVSPLKDQNRIQKEEMEKTDDEKASEKTLHVIVAETMNDIAESTEDSDVVSSLAPQSVPSPKSLSRPLSPSLSSHEGREGEDDDDDDDGDGDGDDDDDDDGDDDGDGDEEEEEEQEGGELEAYEDVDTEEEEVEDENGYARETTGEFSNKNGMANNNDVEAVEGNLGKTLQKSVVFSESKDPRPVKLKFKRGKVVDLRSENNGPRRLRFRRGRVVEENHDWQGEIRRRNLKKKRPDGDGKGTTNPSNEKVVLRHQDMQGRKDAQGLFNNVIEETASKLVESRKSKVKALVGAFETVISLQDTKPSPQTIS